MFRPDSPRAHPHEGPPRALFITDLDGTLLDPAGDLPPANLEAMLRANAAGVALALVTGRRRSTVRAQHARLHRVRYRTSVSNGAVVLAEDHERPEVVRQLSWEAVGHVARDPALAGARVLCITLPAAPEGGAPEPPDALVLEEHSRACFHATQAYDPATYEPTSLEDARVHPLVHVALWAESREAAERFEPRLQEIFGAEATLHSVLRPRGVGEALTEVVPVGGKANAVRHLQERLGLSREATGGIGDDMNDEAILDAVGWRYAVGGSLLASRRPDARAVATAAVGAVADALNRFLETLP